VGFTLSLILLRRKARDGFGLLLAFVFLMSGNTGTVLQPAIARLPALDYFFNNVMGVVSWQLFFITLFLFPNGKLVPSWSRWVIMVWLGYMLWSLLNPNSGDHPLMWLSFLLVFCALGSQVYRQWKQPDPVQRQQIKWVVFAIVVAAVIIGYLGLAGFKPPSDQGYAKDLMIALLQQVVFFLMFMLVMVAILIAIIRYRLYDIDLIIRRTLQYSVLTALLGLIYFGSVVLGQRLAGALTGSPDSPVVLVISTLLIAALFNPLRARVQDFIDRRFYRRKYDALQTLADFTKTARDETQLEVLKPALLEAVQDSVQPEQAWLWLKPKRRG
jgi:hypothetical protein